MTAPLRLVLDTNVVIDWLVFDDPFMNPLREGVATGRVVVLTHEPAITELERVLGYRQLKLDAARQTSVFNSYRQQTTCPPLPDGFALKQLMLPGGFPRCRDRDDEHFLALAFHARADALVSRDNAVTGLKHRATRFGLIIWNVQETIAALSRPDAR